MNSWDCFDTLISRRFFYPDTIFDEVERRLQIKNFSQKRKFAEKNSDGTYKEIYKNLPGIDSNVEFEVELEHCFGIVENINKVQDGDIVVSDMYLSESQIKELLISCGLKKDVKIYVTPRGKFSGSIWKNLPEISLHTGDNFKSDIQSASKYGIKTEYYTEKNFNKIEKFVLKSDYFLACWMRYVRLHCPYLEKDKLFWLDQSNFNLPILALSSLELPNKPIIFTYRDSVYWHPLYESITGKKAKRLDSSRICYKNPSLEFTEYVLEQTKNHVIVDLQGSGESVKCFFKNNFPEIIYVCGLVDEAFSCLVRKPVGDSIERHNCSSLGSVIGWNKYGAIRNPCEHDPKIVEIQSKAMNIAINSTKLFSVKQKDKELLTSLLLFIKKNFTKKNVK
jgi:hypothetical protein